MKRKRKPCPFCAAVRAAALHVEHLVRRAAAARAAANGTPT